MKMTIPMQIGYLLTLLDNIRDGDVTSAYAVSGSLSVCLLCVTLVEHQIFYKLIMMSIRIRLALRSMMYAKVSEFTLHGVQCLRAFVRVYTGVMMFTYLVEKNGQTLATFTNTYTRLNIIQLNIIVRI